MRGVITLKLLVIAFFLTCFLLPGLQAQENAAYNARFRIEDAKGSKFYLVSFSGHDQTKEDSAQVDDNGWLHFPIPGYFEGGIYRIESKGKGGLDFIFNNEDIIIEAGPQLMMDSITVIESEENKMFKEYFQGKNKFMRKISLLEPLVLYYPRDDEFFTVIENKYMSVETGYQSFLTDITERSEGMFLNTLIKWGQLPDIEISQLTPQLRDFYRDHYFDPVSASDTLIINSPILPSRIIDYLSLYVLPGNTREQQEAAFVQGVDGLMAWSATEKTMRDVIINFLIDGFQMYGFESVLTHLVENYVLDNSCVSDQEESKLRKRIEGFRLMGVGKTAPDFTMPDLKGNDITLSLLPGQLKLVVFWASWCPHCTEMMPSINEITGKYGEDQLSVVAVSIDSEKDELKAAIKDKKLDWLNVCDYNGWDSKTVSDYHIYATPTMYLLDENLNILAKPADAAE
jgi:peroxiredoxin